jgi:hypothetical protein
MKSRLAVLTAMALSFSGCWAADTKMMPQSEKVSINLAGTYDRIPMAMGETLTIKQSATFEFEIERMRVNGSPERYRSTLDRVNASDVQRLAPTLSAQGTLFIMETVDGNEISYTLLLLETNENGKPSSLRHFQPICSDAVQAIVGKNPNDATVCKFTSYAQVEQATLDAIQWLSDARIPPYADYYLPRN